MEKTNLAPGFRFRPTDVELVRYYLKRKVMGKKILTNAIAEIDIYKFEPPDLPDKSCMGTGDLKWYFFCPREKRYRNGCRAKRSTEGGYWKVTGKDRDVSYNNEVVGKIKTLVFHSGKTGYGDRTDWVMHEYTLKDRALAQKNVPQEAYALCKVFKKIGSGPRGCDDYGVPFNEADWNTDGEEEEEEEDRENLEAVPSCVSDVPLLEVPPQVASTVSPLLEVPQAPGDNDGDEELFSMLGFFTVDDNDDEPLYLEGFDNQNEVRHDEPEVPVTEEEAAPVCLGDGDFIPELSDDLFIELHDLIEPVTPPLPPPSPAQTGDHGDSKSNGESVKTPPSPAQTGDHRDSKSNGESVKTETETKHVKTL